MKSNIAIKNLINVFGRASSLKFENENLLSIYKIPSHYSNYKRLSLYFGDWTRIKSDCVYLNSKKELDRLLVLSRIANCSIPEEYATGVNDEGLIECIDYVRNCKFIYIGNLANFTPRDDLKSLIVPLDLLHNNAVNCDTTPIKSLANLLEGIEGVDKVVLCTNDNETWITHHKLLKYQIKDEDLKLNVVNIIHNKSDIDKNSNNGEALRAPTNIQQV